MRHLSKRRAFGLAAALFFAMSAMQPDRSALAQDAPQSITVFAAASLKNALDEIAETYEARTGVTVVASLAGSSILARQIQHGAPADIFISANQTWMDVLEDDGAIASETRRDLLANRLALIAPRAGDDDQSAGAAVPPVLDPSLDLLNPGLDLLDPSLDPLDPGLDLLDPGLDLLDLLGDGRIAVALVDAVPAGIYAKAALATFGAWPEIAPRAAQTDNVRAALALVAAGEAPLGIVYATDVIAENRVRLLGLFPEDAHPPIRYPVAALAARTSPETLGFLAFLHSPTARAAFERQGFTVASD